MTILNIDTVSYQKTSSENILRKNAQTSTKNTREGIPAAEQNTNVDTVEIKNQTADSDIHKKQTKKNVLIGLGIGLTALAAGFAIKKFSGIMNNREIMKKSSEFGDIIAHKAAENGQVTINDIQSVINTQLGKKAKNINLVQNKEEFLKALQEAQGVPVEVGEMIWQSSLSASMPNAKGAPILNIRANEIAVDKIANLSAHEYEHALQQAFSFKHKFAKLYLKTPLGKYAFKKMSPYAETINLDVMFMQGKCLAVGKFGRDAAGGITEYKATTEGLLKQAEVSDIKSLRDKFKDFLHYHIINDECSSKVKMYKLQGLKASLPDEARAYAIGGKAEQTYLSLVGKNPEGFATKSELNSMLNKEALKMVKKELRSMRIKRIKEFFGVKSKLTEVKKISISDIKFEPVNFDNLSEKVKSVLKD